MRVGAGIVGSNPIKSHVDLFGPERLLPKAGSAVGSVGRLEPQQPSFIHCMDARVFGGVALITCLAAVPLPVQHRENFYDSGSAAL